MASTGHTYPTSLIPTGEVMAYHGPWALSHAYVVDDVVEDLGNPCTFKCISNHTSAAADEPNVGVNWETYWLEIASNTDNLNNLLLNDNDNATANSNFHSFYVTRFGFSLPAGVVITGIEVIVGAFYYYEAGDCLVRLVKAGALTGTAKTFSMNQSTETQFTVGGSSDLWGATLSDTDVENAGFGVYVYENGGAGSSYNYDYVTINVFYDPPPPRYGYVNHQNPGIV